MIFSVGACSTQVTHGMTLLDEVWPISKDGVDFKIYANGYWSANNTPDLGFDGDNSTQFHTGKQKQL